MCRRELSFRVVDAWHLSETPPLSRCCHASIAEGGDLVAEVRRDSVQLSPREERAGSPLLSMGDVSLSPRDSACAIVSA